MYCYRLAEQDILFTHSITEMQPFEINDKADDKEADFALDSYGQLRLLSRAKGLIGGAQRIVEVYDSARGFLLKVEDCGEFIITSRGEIIGKWNQQGELSQRDREIILGPVIVFALALRGVWSLHASAAIYKENVFAFLGESGQGKSTLAQYLSQSAGWQRVADDILPVAMNTNRVNILPHFPQLKLPANQQPSLELPESLPLKYICILTHAEPHQMPALQKISTAQIIQALLSQIAGTRMFSAELLSKHLVFSTQAAQQVSAYQLINPHRRDALPLIKNFLEQIC